jgi:hypothetical protein
LLALITVQTTEQVNYGAVFEINSQLSNIGICLSW